VPSVALPTSARGAAPIGTAPPSPPRVRRTITLAKVRPVAGVKVAVDGDAAIEASSGITFALNEQAHTLLFTCIEELCEPQTRTVAAGDAEESVEVELKIKPARLVVAGDPSSSFVLREMPTLALLPNVPVAVPMTRKTERFHVRELVVDREIEVTLTAGELTRAIFSEGP
jgi:hypothetical protein